VHCAVKLQDNLSVFAVNAIATWRIKMTNLFQSSLAAFGWCIIFVCTFNWTMMIYDDDDDDNNNNNEY